MKTGIELITEERRDQIEKHGRTTESDIAYNDDEQLADCALELINGDSYASVPDNWNVEQFRYMMAKPRKERLIIAGALIAAEIDRLIFFESKKENQEFMNHPQGRASGVLDMDYNKDCRVEAGNTLSMLQAFSQALEKENMKTSGLIYEIQNKLHTILDKRTPEKDSAGSMPDPHDLATFLSLQSSAMERNSNRLEQILHHLREIA